MGRLFLILFTIFSVLFVLRYIVRALPSSRSSSKRDGDEPPAEGGDTVQCAVCGTYVPKADAIEDGGKRYCSTQHRDDDQS